MTISGRCRTVQIFIVHVGTLRHVLLYNVLLYKCTGWICRNVQILIVHVNTLAHIVMKIVSCTWTHWHICYCSLFGCTPVLVETWHTCRTVQIDVVHVSTITRGVQYNVLARVHGDICRAVQIVILVVWALIGAVLFTFFFYTCLRWQVFQRENCNLPVATLTAFVQWKAF